MKITEYIEQTNTRLAKLEADNAALKKEIEALKSKLSSKK